MFVSLRAITLPQGRDARSAARELAAAKLPGMTGNWAQTTEPGICLNAGDLVWRAQFATEGLAHAAPFSPEWRASVTPLLEAAQVHAVGYLPTRKGLRMGGSGIWRALVFRVMPHGFPDMAREVETALLMMPDCVSTIRSWAFSPVVSCEGGKAFTHVWEQEFDSLDGLTGEYMDHPIHWGLVDGWFDAECPQYIVDPWLIQTVGRIEKPIIA